MPKEMGATEERFRWQIRLSLDCYRVFVPTTGAESIFSRPEKLGPAFGRTDFSRIFIFEPPDFFADSLAGFFLLIFV